MGRTVRAPEGEDALKVGVVLEQTLAAVQRVAAARVVEAELEQAFLPAQ